MPERSSKPFQQRRVSTIFLRVPTEDWPAVIAGRRREFRASVGNVPQLWSPPLPTLCVCYRKRKAAGDYDHRVMVLESVRQERLCEISAEGLVAAGYPGDRDEAYARFRRDWTIREKRKFTPSRKVFVFGVRPLNHGEEITELGAALVRHLYGELLDATA